MHCWDKIHQKKFLRVKSIDKLSNFTNKPYTVINPCIDFVIQS